MLCSGGADLSKYLLTHALLSDHNVMQHVQACILLGQQFLLVLPYLRTFPLNINYFQIHLNTTPSSSCLCLSYSSSVWHHSGALCG